MSEQLHPHHHEQIHHTPEVESPVEQRHHNADHDPDTKHHLKEQAEQLSHKAKHEALSSREYQARHTEQEHPHHAMLVNAELRSMARKRTLTRVRKDLSAPERVLSNIIHQPVVDAISETAAKTVARPSGILSGGIFAFLGTGVVLYICKHFGYTYNFLLFSLLFVGGFCLGLVIELAMNALRRNKSA
jgi:hypothetical protein